MIRVKTNADLEINAIGGVVILSRATEITLSSKAARKLAAQLRKFAKRAENFKRQEKTVSKAANEHPKSL